MWKKWLSRKLLVTFCGVLTTLLIYQFDLPPDVAKEIAEAVMVILSSYLFGQSAVDVATVIKEKSPKNRTAIRE